MERKPTLFFNPHPTPTSLINYSNIISIFPSSFSHRGKGDSFHAPHLCLSNIPSSSTNKCHLFILLSYSRPSPSLGFSVSFLSTMAPELEVQVEPQLISCVFTSTIIYSIVIIISGHLASNLRFLLKCRNLKLQRYKSEWIATDVCRRSRRHCMALGVSN